MLSGDEMSVETVRSLEDYFEDRVSYKIKKYSRKGDRYKVIYWALAVVVAAAGTTVPVLINIDSVPKVIPTALSLVVAILVAVEGIIHPRELWRNYGLISAALREEEMRFSTKTRPYRDDPRDFAEFVDRVERLIAEERSDTILLQTTPRAGGELDDEGNP